MTADATGLGRARLGQSSGFGARRELTPFPARPRVLSMLRIP